MSVKASVSITEQQNAFAREMVAQGRYSSISAVVQQGIEMLRRDNEQSEVEFAALKELLLERSKGPFISMEAFKADTARMIAEKQ